MTTALFSTSNTVPWSLVPVVNVVVPVVPVVPVMKSPSGVANKNVGATATKFQTTFSDEAARGTPGTVAGGICKYCPPLPTEILNWLPFGTSCIVLVGVPLVLTCKNTGENTGPAATAKVLPDIIQDVVQLAPLTTT